MALAWGTVRGRFIKAIADSIDVDSTPDEIPFNGTCTLTPTFNILRFPGEFPPRTIYADEIVCPIVNGDLQGPGGTTDVRIVAANTPGAVPFDALQWTARIVLAAVPPALNPPPVVFTVRDGDLIDLSVVVGETTTVPTLNVITLTVHNALTGRSAADAHPMSAITGLVAALATARSLVLGSADAVPGGTPAGTIIFRTA